MPTLIGRLTEQKMRCQELLKVYAALGSVGQFGFAIIVDALAFADNAILSDDPIDMIRAYDRLKGCE